MSLLNSMADCGAEAVVHAAEPDEVTSVFREVMGRFCTGVVIVTACKADGTPVGMTVGSFASISLEPALVGFFAGHTSTTLPQVVGAGRFCINVLAEDQHDMASRFARSGTDKFADTPWHPAGNGAPRLDGAHAWIECGLNVVHTYGDHDLVVGDVRALTVPSSNDPLLFHQSGFRGIRGL